MKAMNLYILTRNTNSELDTKYENILSGRAESKKVKKYEYLNLNSLVNELLNNGANIKDLDGFYYSFLIQQISKEFDLLKISCNEIVLNIELKSQMIEKEKIEKQLLQNRYYLNHLAGNIKSFTYVQETNTFYKLDGCKLEDCTVNEVIDVLKKFQNYEENDINKLFRARDFLISPLNTPDKFMNDQYFLTDQQISIKKEIISGIKKENSHKIWGITGSAGTGKTLLLYDLAKELSHYGRCCIVHCGMLCSGHRHINKEMNDLEIIEVKSVTDESLSDYSFVLVDEAQRIYERDLNIILTSAGMDGKTCIFSYDFFQVLSYAEENRNIPQHLKSLSDFQERKLTNKIRSNKEIASFIKNLMNLQDRADNSYKYEDIEVLYANDTTEAHIIIDYFCNIKKYFFIGYTQSKYYWNSIDEFPGERNTHEIIGQEFDNVIIMMDSNFRYGEDGKLQGKEHPNPDYIFYKLLYQGISRPREKLCIVVIDNMPLFEKILSIKSDQIC